MDAPRLTEYLERRMADATDLRVINLMRVAGVGCHDAYCFDLEWTADGASKTRSMILQRGPAEREFEILTAMHRAGMKVPAPLFLERDPTVLERPFLVTERAPGRAAYGAAMLAEPLPLRRKLADELVTEMSRLHRLDWRALQLEWLGAPTDLAGPAHAQTRHWRDLYHQDRMNQIWPILDAAFAWLETNPVVTDRITLVHGDFRSGNFLFDDRGLVAILDSKMTHLGDPLEDLAWSTLSPWGHGSLTGGLIDREEFIRMYEAKSGPAVDRKRLFFYQVLGNAKLAVLCLSGIRDFAEGRVVDPAMVLQLRILPRLFDDLATQLRLV